MGTADVGLTLLAEGAPMRHNSAMPVVVRPAHTIDTSARTRALMTWMSPPDESWALQGITQPPVRSGRDVVQGVALPGAVAASIAADVDGWMALGQLGQVTIPPGLSPELTRILTARLSQIRPPRNPPPSLGQPWNTAEPMQKSDGNTPPQAVKDACRRGLDLAPEYGGPGLTEGAKSRARSMADGQSVSDANLRRMKSFFARHDSYTKESSPPSPGYVAWQLWGGDAGKRWANKMADGSNEAAKSKSWKEKGYVGPGGARATADRKAKKKGKGKAYANAIYARMTGQR